MRQLPSGVIYGLEDHFVRGLAKMRTHCVFRLTTMLSMALGRARQNKRKAAAAATKRGPTLRSLVGKAEGPAGRHNSPGACEQG